MPDAGFTPKGGRGNPAAPGHRWPSSSCRSGGAAIRTCLKRSVRS